MEPHEHYEYATLTDCYTNSERICAVESQVQTLRHDHETTARLFYDSILSMDSGESVTFEMDGLKDRMRRIEEALIEIQDSLRRLGMDDMSERLGDLNQLLT